MANITTGNPWTIDTASSTAIANTQGFGRIVRWRWDSEGAAAGDNVIVKDSNARLLWQSTANAANYAESEPVNIPIGSGGLAVSTLGSGTLYIYFT